MLLIKIQLLILLSLTSITAGFFLGSYKEKKAGLEICKEAGWEFIEEEFDWNKYNENDMKILRRMQSQLSTNCIVRFR
jgi:hypothetical protein